MSENNELVQYSKYLDRRLAKLERQESDGYSKSEADAKFVDWVYAFDNFLDIGAYADFVLTSGQATGATLFPQLFSLGVVSNTIWGSGAANGDLILEGTSDATKTSSYVIMQPTGGKVGIGTSTPGDTLHVSGGGVLLDNNNWFRVKNAGGTAIEIAGINASNDVYLGAVANAGGKVVIREDGSDVITLTGGKVGIGTGSPGAGLHVNVPFPGTNPLVKAEMASDTPNDNDFYAWYSSWGPVTGGIRGSTHNGVAWGTQVYSSGALSLSANGFTDTAPQMIVRSDGKVGIGTLSPLQRLSVYSATDNIIHLSHGSNAGWNAIDFLPAGTLSTSNIEWGLGVYPSTSNFVLHSWDGTNAYIRFVVKNDGNVGIGTSDPTLAKLQIDATAGTNALRLNTGRFSMGGSDTFAIDAVGTVGGRFYVAADGKVGIGTSSPGQVLDVNGKIKLRGDQLIFEGGSGLGADQGDATATLYNRAGVGPTFSGLQVVFRTGATPAERLRIDSSGNVGIGTTSPGQKLDVAGTGKFGDYCLIGTSVSAGYYQDSANGAYRAITTSGDVGYYFQSNAGGSTMMFVGLAGTYAGRVGIGTYQPDARLEVYVGSGGALNGIEVTQLDTNKAFMNFVSTDVGSADTHLVNTAAVGTYYGKIKIAVNGTYRYIPVYNS